jgi:hypothetical protein
VGYWAPEEAPAREAGTIDLPQPVPVV